MFRKRIGPDPHLGDIKTRTSHGCPDIWELEDGTFAIIGEDLTDKLRDKLPQSAGCSPEERIVVVPRKTLTRAKDEIPDH